MPRPISKKCITCSQYSAAEAQELHGKAGDRCWNPQTCHSKRSHYRHHQKNVEAKWQRRHGMKKQLQSQPVTEVSVELPAYPVAVLQIYRSNSTSDVHAVGVELWVGSKQVTRVTPVHCLGLTEGQVKGHLHQVLQVLSQQYGVPLTEFGSQVFLDPAACPLTPCSLRPDPA